MNKLNRYEENSVNFSDIGAFPNLDKPELRIERGWDISTCR